MNKKINKLIFAFLLFMLSTVIVDAAITRVDKNGNKVSQAESRGTICAADKVEANQKGYIYNITLPVSDKIKLEQLTINDIKGDTSKGYPKQCFCSTPGGSKCRLDGSTEKCAYDYWFGYTTAGDTCAITSVKDNGDYNYVYCLEDTNDYIKFAEGLYKNVTQVLEGSRDVVSSYSNFSGDIDYSKIKVRVCIGDHCEKEISDETGGVPTSYSQEFTLNSNKFSLEVPAGQQYWLVFYGDTNSYCKDVPLGSYRGVTSSQLVTNDLYNDSRCKAIRVKYSKDSWAGSLMYPCYVNTKITIEQLSQYKKDFNSLYEMYKRIEETMVSTTTSAADYTCAFDESLNTHMDKPIATASRMLLDKAEYWNAECTEELYIDYDTPKKVEAGQSFDYSGNIKIVRTCKPVRIKPVIEPEKCEYGVECWGGPHGYTGSAGAGPNSDFDSCISACDGGKYTQSCINSCYNGVYQKSTTTKKMTLVDNAYPFVKKIRNDADCDEALDNYHGKFEDKYYKSTVCTNNPLSSLYLPDTGNCEMAYGNRWCFTEHGVRFIYNPECFRDDSSGNTECFEVFKTTTQCSTDPWVEYQADLESSYNEYLDVIAAIQEVTNDKEVYTLEIDELYGKTSSPKKQTVTFDNTGVYGDKTYRIHSEEDKPIVKNNNDGTTVRIYDSWPSTIVSHLSSSAVQILNREYSTNSYTVTRNIHLKIGAAYLNKLGNFDKTTSGILPSSRSVAYNVTNDLTDVDKDKEPSLYGPYNAYYTSILTLLGINNPTSWPYYNKEVPMSKSTAEYTKNIRLRYKSLGTWSQWGSEKKPVSIDCFYGTHKGNIDGESLTYIFRPIELTDVFPNGRNARFNWNTGAIQKASDSLYGVVVDPVTFTHTIQTKEQTIYTDPSEIDYQFKLTGDNINNIRTYNKQVEDINHDGANNYLDYDMDCYTRNNANGNQFICLSKMLSDSKYVTGLDTVNRDNIAGCNNARSGGCDVSSHSNTGSVSNGGE